MIINDFECLDCGQWMTHNYSHKDKETLTCTECDSKNIDVRFTQAPAFKTINSREKLNASLKKRSEDDHKRKFPDRLEAAKEKYKKYL